MYIKKAVAGVLLIASISLFVSCDTIASQNKSSQHIERKAEKNGDQNYNVIFITVDQEHYFEQYPAGTKLEARELLKSMGTTFEKHYT